MLIILIRTIVLYFIILFVMRVMGKAELSKMSPFQMIVSLMIRLGIVYTTFHALRWHLRHSSRPYFRRE